MLSHDNFTWNAEAIAEFMEVKRTSEVIVSFLPLSHVAAQVIVPLSTQNTHFLSGNSKVLMKNNKQILASSLVLLRIFDICIAITPSVV
jgi:long-subunit acyl-CoA synthetase (AMP-forming)